MNTLTNTKLGKFTIDDFIALKPVIYEYCINLTPAKSAVSWGRRKQSADDLYQEVYLYVHDNYFNKPKEPVVYDKFVQMMKNCTYWTFYRTKLSNKYLSNRLNNRLTYYQDTPESLYKFESSRYSTIKLFEDIKDHPDYNFYTKGLTMQEKKVLDLILKGYNKTDISKILDRNYTFTNNVLRKVEENSKQEFYIRPKKQVRIKVAAELIYDDKKFVLYKVNNFDKIFKDDRFVKVYSLYLQGFNQKQISEKIGKKPNQVGQEIYRINKRIKSYGGRTESISLSGS